MMPPRFDLLKASAITQIQSDLEGAVEADRILAQTAAATATTQAGIAGGHASDAAGSAAQANTFATQAELSALAAGAPIVTTLTDPVPADGTVELLKLDAGLQVHQVVAGAWQVVPTNGGWLVGPTFDTVQQLLDNEATTLGPEGQIVEAQGFRYEVAASGATDHHVTTAGGVKLYVATGSRISPQTIGALEKTNGQEVILEQFFAIVNAAPRGTWTVSLSGHFYIGRQVEVPSCPRVQFERGELILEPNTDTAEVIPYALHLGEADHCHFPEFRIIGHDSNRTFAYGVLGTYVRGSVFPKIRTSWMRLFGVCISSLASTELKPGFSNSNTLTIDEQWHADCGIRGQAVSFEEVSRNTSAAPASDVSVISCDLNSLYDLPVIQDFPILKINGHYFTVKAYDESTQQATIFPSLAVASGSLISGGAASLYAGGGFLAIGADAGQGRTKNINVRRSACAVMAQSAYGWTYGGVTSQFNDFGVILGRPPATFSQGDVFVNYYLEGETEPQFMVTSQNASATILDVATNLATVYQMLSSAISVNRTSLNQAKIKLVGKHGQFNSKDFGGAPRVAGFRRGDLEIGPINPDSEFMTRAGGFPVISFDNNSRNYVFNLGATSMNTKTQGPSAFAACFIGVGLGNKITMNAPAGDTIDGEASIVLVGLPVRFFLTAWKTGPTAWNTAIVEMASAAGYIEP